MQHEQHEYDGDNLAEVWQSAQHRRTEDIYSWFTRFFERQRRKVSRWEFALTDRTSAETDRDSDCNTTVQSQGLIEG